jgi:transposase
VREAIEACGATLLYLPPYSPDLNPIELAFSKLKRLLRSTAARTVNALWTAIGRLLGAFEPGECARYLGHCGYPQTGL